MLRTDLILVYKILHNKCAISIEEVFVLNQSSNTRGHQLKLFKPRTQSECRKRFFSLRVINVWNSLSHDTVIAGSLNKFKALLKRDLGEKLYEFL